MQHNYQPVAAQPPFNQYHVDERPKIYNPRLGFIKKVYGIISCQLLLTTLSVLLFQGPLRKYFYRQYHIPQAFWILLYVSIVEVISCSLVICFCRSLTRRVPNNYILLGVFTLAESYAVGFSTVFCDPADVLLAAVLTLTITFALTLYAWTTKKDFTVYGAALWISGWSLLAFSLLFFLRAQGTVIYTPGVILGSIASIIVYSIYLIYDTQMLIGGHLYELGLDDYVLASMCIYMDIIVLFTKILRVIAAIKKK